MVYASVYPLLMHAFAHFLAVDDGTGVIECWINHNEPMNPKDSSVVKCDAPPAWPNPQVSACVYVSGRLSEITRKEGTERHIHVDEIGNSSTFVKC